MPQGIKGWAIWVAVQAALTYALKLLIKLADNALMGWGDDKLAEFFGITSPNASTVFNWAVPFVMAAVALYLFHHLTTRPLREALARQSGGDRFSATGIVYGSSPRTWIQRVEPYHIIILGLAIALCGVIWQIRAPHKVQEANEIVWNFDGFLGAGWDEKNGVRVSKFWAEGLNGPKAASIGDAFVVSGMTGIPLAATISTANGYVALAQSYPIPANAKFHIQVLFYDPSKKLGPDEREGMPETTFLNDWGKFEFAIKVDGIEHKYPFDKERVAAQLARVKPKTDAPPRVIAKMPPPSTGNPLRDAINAYLIKQGKACKRSSNIRAG